MEPVTLKYSSPLDARDARPVDLAVPHRTARLMEWNLFAARDICRPNESLVYAVSGDHSVPLYTGNQGVAPRNDMVSFIQGRFAEPGQKGDYLDTPYEYDVGGGATGELFTGLRLHPRQHEFATVRDTFAAVSNGPRFGYVTAELPPEDAAYWLEATVEPTFSRVSTRITSVWSFRSGHVTGPQATALPLLAFTYRPELDERNSARPGPRFTIPIEVTRQPGSGSPTVAELTMEVSYDDGATW